MTIQQNHIGCDISKQTLDIFDPRTGKFARVDNERAALQAFARTLDPDMDFLVFEATGHHDRLLRITLAQFSIACARLNPVMTRRFAQSRGRLAKTDRLDARMLSQYGSLLRPGADEKPDLERERLAAFARRRDQLVDARARELRHLSEVFDAGIADDIHAVITGLDARIAALETEIQRQIQAVGDLAARTQRLCSAPGVGKVTALALVSLMPELGHANPKAIASLAGLAPMNNDSGQKRGVRSIKGGRRRVRSALYMAALGAIRASARFNTFYQAIAQRSGSKKIAIIATARKLLTVLNAMERTQKAFI